MNILEPLVHHYEDAARLFRAGNPSPLSVSIAEQYERMAHQLAGEIQAADLAEIEARTHGPGCKIHGEAAS